MTKPDYKMLFSLEIQQRTIAAVLFLITGKLASKLLTTQEMALEYYVLAFLCAVVVLGLVLRLGDSPLVRDLAEICFYDVLLAPFGLFMQRIGQSVDVFLVLAYAIGILKMVRLIWWGRNQHGELAAAWPVFGLLGLFSKNWYQDDLSKRHNRLVYAACVMTVVIPAVIWQAYGRIDDSLYLWLALIAIVKVAKPITRAILAITAQKEAAEREKGALEKQAEIDANVKERNADLRQAAHDMLGPLKAITTIAAEIARSEDLASARQAAGHVQNGLIELDDLMREVIVMAKIVTQLQTPNDEIIDMGKLGDYFQRYLTNIAMERHIHLSVDPANYKVMSNAWLLKRILYNLLMNAINHGDNQTNVRLYLRKNAHWCYIRIWDTGPGIPHANGPDRAANLTNLLNNEYLLQHAFDDDSTAYLGGYGLGLRGVLRMCHTLGITITLVSKPRHTVFRFRVPLADPSKLPPASREPDLFNLHPEAEPPVKK